MLIDFHKKDLQKKRRNIENLKGTLVEFYIMKAFDGKSKAESIEITKQSEISNNISLEGKTFEGIVKNVTDFGIFVNLSGKKDGLFHKNNLPSHLKNGFKDKIKIGVKLNVKVISVTDKGVQLRLLN